MPKLALPSLPEESSKNKEKSHDRELIDELKLVADYTGLTIPEALDLSCDFFALSLKKAYIEKLNQTEKGREYLETCKNIQTTECDLDALLDVYGGEEE